MPRTPRLAAWIRVSALGVALCATVALAAPTATITVDPSTVVNPSARRLLGPSVDGRTGIHQPVGGGVSNPTGYFDPNNQLLAGVAPLWSQIQLTTLSRTSTCADEPGASAVRSPVGVGTPAHRTVTARS